MYVPSQSLAVRSKHSVVSPVDFVGDQGLCCAAQVQIEHMGSALAGFAVRTGEHLEAANRQETSRH